MTRKDYIKIAAAFRRATDKMSQTDSPYRVMSILRDEIGDTLRDDNPNFDRARFEAATVDNARSLMRAV